MCKLFCYERLWSIFASNHECRYKQGISVCLNGIFRRDFFLLVDIILETTGQDPKIWTSLTYNYSLMFLVLFRRFSCKKKKGKLALKKCTWPWIDDAGFSIHSGRLLPMWELKEQLYWSELERLSMKIVLNWKFDTSDSLSSWSPRTVFCWPFLF